MDIQMMESMMMGPTVDDLMEKGIGYNNPRIKGRYAMKIMKNALQSAGFPSGSMTEKPKKTFNMKIMENAMKAKGFKYSWELRKKAK